MSPVRSCRVETKAGCTDDQILVPPLMILWHFSFVRRCIQCLSAAGLAKKETEEHSPLCFYQKRERVGVDDKQRDIVDKYALSKGREMRNFGKWVKGEVVEHDNGQFWSGDSPGMAN